MRSVDADGRELEALLARPDDLSREVDRRAHPDHEDDLAFDRDSPSGEVRSGTKVLLLLFSASGLPLGCNVGDNIGDNDRPDFAVPTANAGRPRRPRSKLDIDDLV